MRLLLLTTAIAVALAGLVHAQETGYILMPASKDGTWHVSTGPDDDRHWGKPETVRMLILVATEWHKRHGTKIVVDIGDMSKRDGGPFPPHVTHRDGCCIDVTTSPQSICNINYPDQEVSLELARLFLQYGAKEILYNGTYVQKNLPEVHPWEKHDDHFHVIVDPKKVPAEGEPVLVAEADSVDGAWIGPSRLQKQKDGTPRFPLSWRVLGAADHWQKGYRLVFGTQKDEANGVLFDSGMVASPAASCLVSAKLDDRKSYWWKLTVSGASGEVELPWQQVRTWFSPAVVTAVSPSEGEEVDENPLLKWKTDGGPHQGACRIEVTLDTAQKRAPYDTGDLARTDSELRLKGALVRGKTWWWRVTVDDGHGNRGTSEWRSFKTSDKYQWIGDPATVEAAELNLRDGPNEHKALVKKLKSGDTVYVVAKKDEWLQVVIVADGKQFQGWVAAKYVKQ